MQAQPLSAAIVVHGGASAGRSLDDGCLLAANAARSALDRGDDALGAAIAAVLVLENDPRYNAGTGASLGLDGKSIEMDAAVMDTRGRLGAVAALRAVQHPILVARAVADTPHCLLAGAGALSFARLMGHPEYDNLTPKAVEELDQMLCKLASAEQAMAGEANEDFARFWNYDGPPTFGRPGGTAGFSRGARDTVGAVVRDSTGHFAVAGSTGGSAPSLLGRVGDTPIVGSGFYAGPHGAVAATGVGEHIIRSMLAATVYHWLAGGMDLSLALGRGIELIPAEVDVGLIAVSRTQSGARSNADMPHAVLDGR